jgi:hypothetical protein
MASIASFSINDGLATPVSHTYTPILQEGQVSEWRDKASAVVKGWPSVSIRHTVDDPSSDVFRVKISLAVPTLEALSSSSSGFTPGPTLAYTTRFNAEFIVPRRATLQERKDIFAYAWQLVATGTVGAAVQNLDVPY